MKFTWIVPTTVLAIGLLAFARPVRAEYPALYYNWKALDTDIDGCLNRAEAVMQAEGLEDIYGDASNVYGNTDSSNVAIHCFSVGGQTVAMVIVAGEIEDEVLLIRENLTNQI